jgi:hypothetical protein
LLVQCTDETEGTYKRHNYDWQAEAGGDLDIPTFYFVDNFFIIIYYITGVGADDGGNSGGMDGLVPV